MEKLYLQCYWRMRVKDLIFKLSQRIENDFFYKSLHNPSFCIKEHLQKKPKEDSTLVYHLKFLLWEFFGKQFDNFLTFSLHRVCVSVTAGRIFMSYWEYCSIKIKDLNFIKWDFLNCSCGLQGKKCPKILEFDSIWFR